MSGTLEEIIFSSICAKRPKRRSSDLLGGVALHDIFDREEDDQCDDRKVDDSTDQITEQEPDRAHLEDRSSPVTLGYQDSNDWHDDITDDRCDQFGCGRTDDDRNGEPDYLVLFQKVQELFLESRRHLGQSLHSTLFLFEIFRPVFNTSS